MTDPFNPISEKLFSRHSPYSRYSSQKKKVDPESWSYTIQPGYFPAFPEGVFRILSINLQRFPMSYYSPVVIESVVLSALPHVFFIQELSRTNSIKEIVDFINDYQSDRIYKFKCGIDTVRNLQLSIIYDSKSIDLLNSANLFRDYSADKDTFNRPVLFLSCDFDDFLVNFYNLHLPSNRKIGSSDMRINCFSALGDYFDSLDSNTLYLLGGDWNVASSSSLFATYLSSFRYQFKSYSNSSDMILNNLNAEKKIIEPSPSQYFWDYAAYNQIVTRDWLSYVSDHFPIVCDYIII